MIGKVLRVAAGAVLVLWLIRYMFATPGDPAR